MVNPAELVSVLIVLEFVVMASIVLVLVPFEVAAPLLPLLLFLLVVLHVYSS